MKIVKVTLNLPEDAVNSVKALAKKRGTSMTEVIRQAIGSEKFFFDAIKNGGKVLVEDKHGKMKQVIYR